MLVTAMCPVGDHPFEFIRRGGRPRVYCSRAHARLAPSLRALADGAAERWCPYGQHMAPLAEFTPSAGYCRPCTAAYMRERREADPEAARTAARRGNLWRYRVTPEQFDAMLASQNGRCAICRTDDPGPRGWRLDHNHRCGGHGPNRGCQRCVRGILCYRCNDRLLGIVDDSVEVLRAAIDYLEAHPLVLAPVADLAVAG